METITQGHWDGERIWRQKMPSDYLREILAKVSKSQSNQEDELIRGQELEDMEYNEREK